MKIIKWLERVWDHSPIIFKGMYIWIVLALLFWVGYLIWDKLFPERKVADEPRPTEKTNDFINNYKL